jgi:hypothetical protein
MGVATDVVAKAAADAKEIDRGLAWFTLADGSEDKLIFADATTESTS